MEWQQIEYFQTVARVQHITRAARILSISQPALSRSIARLEGELGVPLFEREGRSILLNRYGELFLKRANRILKEYYDGKREIQDLINPDYGEVSLGFLHTLGMEKIPDLIGTFRKQHPQLRFSFNQNNSAALVKQLVSGEFDLCLTTPMETNVRISWQKLWDEELFVIVPADHKLANRESITLDEISEESFIAIKEGNSLRQIMDQLCEEAGIRPKILFEGEEIHTIAGLVGAGLGVSIIPDIKGLDQTKLSRLHVKWPKSERVIGIAWLDGGYLSAAAIRFKEFVVDYFKK
ncbi:LysR family transcriptional regulator [Lentibacillus sp. N15]|uniref:LysR family transcriptional regulator n=1 Tax=Lentibacillus songyuanensis TaxID=3136161 RepID=UPI0031BA9703